MFIQNITTLFSYLSNGFNAYEVCQIDEFDVSVTAFTVPTQ